MKTATPLNNESHIKDLELLAEELTKTEPEDQIIKNMMKKMGIPYTDDPVERINRVLKALYPSHEKKQ